MCARGTGSQHTAAWHSAIIPAPARSYNPYVVAQRIHELDEEMSALRMELSPQYSALILKYSSYSKPQQVGRVVGLGLGQGRWWWGRWGGRSCFAVPCSLSARAHLDPTNTHLLLSASSHADDTVHVHRFYRLWSLAHFVMGALKCSSCLLLMVSPAPHNWASNLVPWLISCRTACSLRRSTRHSFPCVMRRLGGWASGLTSRRRWVWSLVKHAGSSSSPRTMCVCLQCAYLLPLSLSLGMGLILSWTWLVPCSQWQGSSDGLSPGNSGLHSANGVIPAVADWRPVPLQALQHVPPAEPAASVRVCMCIALIQSLLSLSYPCLCLLLGVLEAQPLLGYQGRLGHPQMVVVWLEMERWPWWSSLHIL